MGKVTRQVYNEQLMNIVDYDSTRSIRFLISQYFNLLELAKHGDTVAHSILLDIKRGLQVLTDRQREAIVLSLMCNFTQQETAEEMGISQPRVVFLIMSGVEAIKSFLNCEHEIVMTEGEKKFMLSYLHKLDLGDKDGR